MSELHGKMLDTLSELNSQLLELAAQGSDIRIQITGMDEDLLNPKSNPQIVIRVTRLLPFSTPEKAEVLPFTPKLVSQHNGERE